MNPFVTRISAQNAWLIPLSVTLLLLGILISMTWLTDKNLKSRIGSLSAEQRQRVTMGSIETAEEYSRLLNEVTKLKDENTRLREENTKMQNGMASSTNQTKLLNNSLQDSKIFAGLTDVEGPGIVVTLRDRSPGKSDIPLEALTIHDTDVMKAVNELWNAGAEALSVNNRRVGIRTNFRCVGSVIMMDNVPIASPVIIKAIGDSPTLLGAMRLPGGIVDELRSTGSKEMISVEESAKDLRLPSFAGSTAHKYIRIPEDKK